MRKVVVGLLAAAGIALAVPAHAQGIWFGAGPVGIGFGAAPYGYDNGPYWGGSYAYAPGYAYSSGYGYTYGPGVGVGYAYSPGYSGYSYDPDYAYTTTYAAPAYGYSSYEYEPTEGYARSVVGIRSSHRIASRHLTYRSARISGEAYRAQASVPLRHVVRHSRSIRIDRDNTSVPAQGVLKR